MGLFKLIKETMATKKGTKYPPRPIDEFKRVSREGRAVVTKKVQEIIAYSRQKDAEALFEVKQLRASIEARR